MTPPLAHLYALALRTLETQERRAGELRARLAPVLAAGGVGATLLGPGAASALVFGGPLTAGVLVAAFAGSVVTMGAAGRLLTAEGAGPTLDAARLQRTLARQGALDDETVFYTQMIAVLELAERRIEAEVSALQRLFTVVMCGILFVLCGLALAALVA
jgi:hypothetical protein